MNCFHCGTNCGTAPICFDNKEFCCTGCKTVYEIFSANQLEGYYDLDENPGIRPGEVEGKFDFLDNQRILEKLLEFSDGDISVAEFYIPSIHCSSCIWILENLHKLHRSVKASQVDFPRKKLRVTFSHSDLTAKELVLLLSRIGYEPYISLEDAGRKEQDIDRSLIYKLGVAGFAFGNVMLLSFPEYFEIDEFWLNQYKPFFRWIMFGLSLPVVFYAAGDYFKSAFKGIRAGLLNIDIPIALGIAVLFLRSTWEIATNTGQGFFDSLTGLLFFLLLGRYFQEKTYSFLSFERDYKSYFPVGVTRMDEDGQEISTDIYDIKEQDRLLIRNQELIPVDGILLNGKARIDYSFVTGESDPVTRESGEKLFAGGKQTGTAIEMVALNSVSQSYLTQLWSNEVFSGDKQTRFQSLTDRISKYFTAVILLIAFGAGTYWYVTDPALAAPVFTAILIVACPCALALSAPFTLGNMLRIFGKQKFYLKNAQVIERMAGIDTVIFDKTGTITANANADIAYEGVELTRQERSLLRTGLRNSNHPLSRQLYEFLQDQQIDTLDHYKESTGKGLEMSAGGVLIRAGSRSFAGSPDLEEVLNTSVYVSTGEAYRGRFTFYNRYRKGVAGLFRSLAAKYRLGILSGDNESERENLQKLLPAGTKLFFNQKPEDKLNYVRFHQEEGASIMMVGDGLNDAGALQQSDVGVAVSENINVFSPACDAILDAEKLPQLGAYLKASAHAVTVIKASFVLSFLYNLVGLYFAVTGALSPVIAAILMPLSSISVVLFTTGLTGWIGKKLN